MRNIPMFINAPAESVRQQRKMAEFKMSNKRNYFSKDRNMCRFKLKMNAKKYQ